MSFTPPASSWNPAVDQQSADSGDWNDLLTAITDAINTRIATDGTATVTANIPMAGHKFTGLSAGTTNGDSVRYEQAQATNANLTAIAALTFADNSMIDLTGASAAAVVGYDTVYKNVNGDIFVDSSNTSHTYALTDINTVLVNNSGGSPTYTVPPESSVAWVTRNMLGAVTLGGAVTISAGAGVTFLLLGTGTSTSTLTLTAYGRIWLSKFTTSNVWFAWGYGVS